MKKKILISILFIIGVILSGLTSAYATNYLYNSNEVYYDNSESNLTSSDVQGAIDELYTEATNYSSINTRVTTLETLSGSNTLTTISQTLTGAINEINSKQMCYGVTGTTDNMGYLIITHNLNMSRYVPFVEIASNSAFLYIANIQDVSNNHFRVAIRSGNGAYASSNINVRWCYIKY